LRFQTGKLGTAYAAGVSGILLRQREEAAARERSLGEAFTAGLYKFNPVKPIA
jgi:hypothetical protein